ncbi:MAG: hypothetical protein APU95_04275 [Hadesarchaea archaeon YNP_N21]|jgi:simple sugar transport system permease protein|nr:MAG: hypothetical protein APU95_04275 [Hadesarchaea archaeon YNP_N21]
MRVLKAPSNPLLSSLFSLVLSIGGGFLVGGILIFMAGQNPLLAFYAIFYGAFGSLHSLSETLVKSTPILFTSLAVITAFNSGVWNIGAEGQLVLGAIATTGIGLFFGGYPAFVLIPICMVLSFAAGMLWASIPGFLKARLNINEILITVMMNFVALYLLRYLVTGPWRDPTAAEAFTPILSESIYLPKLLPGTRLHFGLLIALLCAFLVFLILYKTPVGYKLRAVGKSPKASKYGGISVSRNFFIAMALSGGLAGLAGMSEIAGIYRRMMEGISAGYGFTAIPVALIAKLHPLGAIPAAVLFAALLVGGDAMQRVAGVPVGIIYAFQALIIIFFVISDYLKEMGK